MIYLKDVVTLELDQAKCTGCGMCMTVCPHTVFGWENKKAVIMNKDACMECGACAMNCSEQAISVRPGVGCAMSIIIGKLTGKEPTCGCSTDTPEETKTCC